MIRSILLGGRQICYDLLQKKVKNINLRIRRDGSISVSAPKTVRISDIEQFLRKKTDFILRALDRFQAYEEPKTKPNTASTGDTVMLFGSPRTIRVEQGNKNTVRLTDGELTLTVLDPENEKLRRETLNCYIKHQFQCTALELCRAVYPQFASRGIPFPKIRFRTMKTRWGSCTPAKKSITLNNALSEAPLPCLEYVICHEFAHFLQANHSPAFYRELEHVLPDWKTRRAKLNGK